MAEPRTVAERIGGRWAISLRGWAVMSAILIVSLTFSTPQVGTEMGISTKLVGIALVGALLAGAMLLFVDRTLFRHRAERPVPVSWVVGLGLLLGLAQSSTTLILFSAIGLDAAIYPTSRLVVVPLFAAGLLIATALTFDDIETYRSARDGLLQRAADLRSRSVERRELTRTIEEAVQGELAITTRSILGDLDGAHPDMTREERLEMARALQQIASHQLRPLSQRLFATPMAPLPRARFAEALRVTLGSRSVQPGWTAIAVGITGFSYLIARGSLTQSLWQSALAILVVYVALAGTTRLAARRQWRRTSTLAVAIAVATVANAIKSLLVPLLAFGALDPATLLISLIWVPIVAVVVSVVAAATDTREESLRQLEYEVDERVLDAIIANRELVRVSRELAGHVHGTLQSTLLATAFAIENATRTNDGASFDAAVEGARLALSADASRPQPAAELALEVQRHVDLWSEFTAVTTSLPAAASLAPGVVADVGRIVEEGIGNAKKHGGARRIHVAVEQLPPELLRISISDDGRGPAEGAPGLGASLLDEVAPGRWVLRPNPAGAGSLLIVDLLLR
jgi:signal transduction histidine kinase